MSARTDLPNPPRATGQTPGNSGHLEGSLGVPSIVFMVVAAAAPLTVIGGNVALTVGSGNGIGAPAGFLIASVVLLLFSIGFVAMTPHIKESGAYCAYIRESFGQHAGVGAAFLAFVTYTAIEIGIYGFLGGSTAAFVEGFGGPAIAWWVYALAAWFLVMVLGVFSIDFSSKLLGLLMVCEIGIVLVLDAAILAQGGAEGLSAQSFLPANVLEPTLGVAVLFALTGFIGFEATAVFRDEAKNPDRTIPRATYVAVLVIGGFYTVSSWLLVEAWGPANAVRSAVEDPNNFMLGAMETYAGLTARHIMDAFLLTSLLACVLSLHNIATRYQFTLAGEGYLPRVLHRVHPRFGSPYASSLGQSAVVLAVIIVFSVLDVDPLVNVFGSMAGVATVGFVLLLIFTSASAVLFFRRNRQLRTSVLRMQVIPSVAAVLLTGCLVLVLVNFPLVTSAPWSLSIVLALVPVLSLAAGYALSARRPADR